MNAIRLYFSFFFFLAALVRCAVFALCASTHLFAQHCPRVVAILSYDILPVEDIYYNFFFFCGENTKRALE